MNAQLPAQLQYSQLQAKAFFSVFKQWPIQPIANSGQYFPGQVIRIFLNALTDGVMDPFRSHLEITVSCSADTLPVGLLQVDNSAQSFISQFVLSSRNRQVQRIIQYGCLAAYLTDVGISEIYTEGKQTQGLGYSNINTYSGPWSAQTQATSVSVSNIRQNQAGQRFVPANGGIFPTIPYRTGSISSWGEQQYSMTQLSGSSRGHISYFNPCWVARQQSWWWYKVLASDFSTKVPMCNDTNLTTSISYYGYANNLRAQYLNAMNSNQYIDSSTSYSKYQTRLNLNVFNNKWPAKFQNQTKYQVVIPSYIASYIQQVQGFSTGQQFIQQVPNTVNLWGYTNLYGPAFSKGVRQPFISPTVPQVQIQNGVILPRKIPVTRKTFKIPLISAIIGLLIPEEQFVLIPLRALNDGLIQITIDPAAMFTSGYNDISQFDDRGMALMQQRAFTVQRVVYNLHTYTFFNPEMDQYLKININSGIAINTHMWQLGNQYQIQNSQSIGNSWPVACNQEALNQILVLFYPMDYQQFSFCRKHYRLSNNILRLQLRINMEYYPSQPLSGNAGNPVQIDNDPNGNNSIFLQQIYQSNGYFFSNSHPMPRINAFNFSLNDRPYNILNTNPFYDAAMLGDLKYNWTTASVNCDTALGMANIHQNRCVGKAAYLFSFQPYAHSKNLLTGIDCTKAKQFDVIFGTSPQKPFPRPQMMLIYTRSSNIIQFGRQGISVIKN